MSDKTELLPCPFCGGDAASDAHAEDCYFSVTEAFKAKAMKNADMSLAPAVLRAWNRRAALTQQPAQAVPDGWKLVPVDPTEEMLSAMTAYDGNYYTHPFDEDDFAKDYAALLAAAPAAPVSQEPTEDAGLAFSALPCAGFWRWLHRCNRVPAAAEQPDTVNVHREQLADAVVLFEKVLGWTTSSDYEAAASACSRLRALLDGGSA